MARGKKDIADMHKSPFPVALRALMSEKPVTTQEKLAEITGKTRQTVSQYVNGISEPGYDTLVKIADYFDVSVDYLLGRTKDRRRHENIYDGIGLTEEGTTALRLAYAAQKDASKTDELIAFIYGPEWNKERDPDLYAPGELEESYAYLHAKTRLLSKVLPDLVDMIIEIAQTQGYEEIVRHFANLAYPDCRCSDIESIMSASEYSRFKAYEITEIIKAWLVATFCGS